MSGQDVLKGAAATAVQPAQPREEAAGEPGLLSNDQLLAALRATLGDIVPDHRLRAAAKALQDAEAARWQMVTVAGGPGTLFDASRVAPAGCCGLPNNRRGASIRVFRWRG